MTTMELEAQKASLAREILNIDNMELLNKLKKYYQRVKKQVPADGQDTISKEEILAGIDAGLKDWKAGRKTPAREFLKELRDEI